MLALTWLEESVADARISRTRLLTSRPFGINLVLAFAFDGKLARALDNGVGVVSTAWGDPGAVRSRFAGSGAIHLHACGSVDEARRAADVGVDVIVAQGWEAGGHVLGQTASLALVPAVVDAVRPLPVVAAGGIADGRGLAAVLMLGAQAAMVGTRFLATNEAFTHEVYRQRVIAADPDDATYTTAFDGGWPGAPHRTLRNRTLTDWEQAGRPEAPHRPGEGETVAVDAAGTAHMRYEDLMPLPGMHGELEDMALYAGQSVGLVHETLPAAEVVRGMVRQAESTVAQYRSGRGS
jgi:NAD(P)H-dependent flavin oxidoreductase YrpB (nitropropane dioxygenase family)